MEGRKEEQYKKSPYTNNNSDNNNIEEMMSKMKIEEKREEKKWVEKEEEKKEEKKQQINYEDPEIQKTLPLWLQKGPGEENQITPLWKRRLAELESPYINDTIKGIVADIIESQKKNLKNITGSMMFTEKTKFFILLYCSICLKPNDFLQRLANLELSTNKEPGKYFAYANHLANFAEDNIEWYKNSSPFFYIFDGKLNDKIPQTQKDVTDTITSINEVFMIHEIDMIKKLDPKQTNLSDTTTHTNGALRDIMIGVEKEFKQKCNHEKTCHTSISI